MVKRVLIVAGGTGGHVFPALTIGRALKKQGIEVDWLGSHHGIETTIVPQAGFPLHQITISALRGCGIFSWLFAPWRLLFALVQALKIILKVKPDVVLGMGGFVSGPGCLAAWLLRKKLVIHEQNAVIGLTNRLLARLAAHVLTGFPLQDDKSVYVGNPVREEIASLAIPEERYAKHLGAIRLLILGGSQGSLSFNQIIPETLATLPDEIKPEIWHQAGKKYHDVAETNYKKLQINARVEPFIANMPEAYEWADLVICRAGASTIAELSAAGVPAIFIPYPYAVDDHQFYNAQFLVDAKAALLMRQDSLEPKKLAALLIPLLKDREVLLKMAQAARKLRKTDTVEQVMAAILG